jgi:glycosyltransferase involved in cell wall biosynthesis
MTPAMKILMTTDTIGGVWTFTVDLVKALKPFHLEILLASLGYPPSTSQKEQLNKIPYVELRSRSCKLEWMDNPWEDIEKGKSWIIELANDFKPDIVHLNSYTFNPDLFNAPSLVTGHSCVSSWWQSVKEESLPGSWRPYFETVKNTLQSAAIVTAPSKYMLDFLLKLYGPLKKAKVIYNAGHPDFFWSDQEKRNIIFSMGRIWDEAKNMKLLIEAARSINSPVIIAGDKNKKNQDNLPNNILFTGQLSKKSIASWLAKAAVFVMPSLYEPFGLAALEAAYSNCALLLSDIPSLREIWEDSALFFNPRNAGDLSNKLLQLTSNDYLRKQFSSKALSRSKQFRPDRMANQYYSLYSDLLKTTGMTKLNIRNIYVAK